MGPGATRGRQGPRLRGQVIIGPGPSERNAPSGRIRFLRRSGLREIPEMPEIPRLSEKKEVLTKPSIPIFSRGFLPHPGIRNRLRWVQKSPLPCLYTAEEEREGEAGVF